MKYRVRPGPRPGWGRVDLKTVNDEYIVNGKTVKMTKIGRFQQPCLIFPLASIGAKVGDEVEVEPVLHCRLCGWRTTVLINGVCDNCYQYIMIGDAVKPPLAAVQTAAGEGEGHRPERGGRIIR